MEHDIKIFTENIEPEAVNQIYNLITKPPFHDSKVRIMPDVHFGSGCVVGFTATLSNMVIPSVIGVDIGCGMLTVKLGKISPDLEGLDKFINENIPSGSRVHDSYGRDMAFVEKLRCKESLEDFDRVMRSLGTLGGGNHFIELDKDEDDNIYLVIHSGSRNLGLQVAKLYQRLAVDACKNAAKSEKERVHKALLKEKRIAEIPDALSKISEKYSARSKTPAEYCYFEGDECDDYMHDMRICQEFAAKNRRKIADDIMKYLSVYKAEFFETFHNYIDENMVVRKGAIAASKGQRVIIPMNMKDGCIIARGKGNPDWNFSAPHGAGRLVSRGEAKELFTLDEYKLEMQGVYTSSATLSTIDESPMAYKPMNEIVSLISPTVEIERIIKPIYNFKAGSR